MIILLEASVRKGVYRDAKPNLLPRRRVKREIVGAEPKEKRLAEIIQHGAIPSDWVVVVEGGQLVLGPLVQRRRRDEFVC